MFRKRKQNQLTKSSKRRKTDEKFRTIGNDSVLKQIIDYVQTDPFERKKRGKHTLCISGPNGIGKSYTTNHVIKTYASHLEVIRIKNVMQMDNSQWVKFLATLQYRQKPAMLFLDDCFANLSITKLEVLSTYLSKSYAWKTPIIIVTNTTWGPCRNSILKSAIIIRMWKPYDKTITYFLRNSMKISSSYCKHIVRLCKGDLRQATNLGKEFKKFGNCGIFLSSDKYKSDYDWVKYIFDFSKIDWSVKPSQRCIDIVHSNYMKLYGDDGYIHPFKRKAGMFDMVSVEEKVTETARKSANDHPESTGITTLADIAANMSAYDTMPIGLVSTYIQAPLYAVKIHNVNRVPGRLQLSSRPSNAKFVAEKEILKSAIGKLCQSRMSAGDYGLILYIVRNTIKQIDSVTEKILALKKLDLNSEEMHILSRTGSLYGTFVH